nr:CMF_HP1_G0048190.mRNA.1.CDS.1 [Saccharomyces cerevisiae]
MQEFKIAPVGAQSFAEAMRMGSEDGKYDLNFKEPNSDPSHWLSPAQLAEYYHSLLKKYPIISLEDPTPKMIGPRESAFLKTVNVQIIADDLTCTNKTRIARAIEEKCANTLLLKLNQIGTLTESIKPPIRLSMLDGV